jgi:hypothetical protein
VCIAAVFLLLEHTQFFLWLADWIALISKRGNEICSDAYSYVGVAHDPSCKYGKALIGLTVAIWVTFWFTSYIVVINAFAYHETEGFDLLTRGVRGGLYRRVRKPNIDASLAVKEAGPNSAAYTRPPPSNSVIPPDAPVPSDTQNARFAQQQPDHVQHQQLSTEQAVRV